MRIICDTCNVYEPVTMDHNGTRIECECIGCGGKVNFGRVQTVDGARKARQNIFFSITSPEKIIELKDQIIIGRPRLVRRDVAYHNLLILVRMNHMCFRCDHTSPVKFSRSGKHVKASCAHCGFYIKFVPQGEIPKYVDTKSKIWALTKDLELIAKSKTEINFNEAAIGMDKDLNYFNLYSHIVKNNFV